MNDTKALYDLWLEKTAAEPALHEELTAIAGKAEEIEDRFYRTLTFGTGGLRGVIGAGTNRMNRFTVNQATQGLANYLLAHFEAPTVAIAYDSRKNSDVFAKSAACVLAANGIPVYIYPTLVPTPMLSFAVRRLGCASGIVITASHNPGKYNGYKCYDPQGYQMTDDAAAETYEYIQKVDIFDDVKTVDFDKALSDGTIRYIGEDVFEEFYKCVMDCQINPGIAAQSGLRLIYTPLNGTGNKPVREVLRRCGWQDVTVVPEQENPDGNFPTCPYPNPEIREAFTCALAMAEKQGADLLLATDPDCDRVGIAVNVNGEYKLISGNEVGALLTEYVLSSLQKRNALPKDGCVIKSFVTTELITKIAADYGCTTYNLLTGFKYIGELITQLEDKGEVDRFIIGMEESYGYLSGIHARDKDGVNAAVLISEMAAYYKLQGKTLWDVLEEIFAKYGRYQNSLHNYAFEGASGMQTMTRIMDSFRTNPPKAVGGMQVTAIADYNTGVETNLLTGETKTLTLPKSNVIDFKLENGNGVIARPSGTEPKLKLYVTAIGTTNEQTQAVTDAIIGDMAAYLK